MTSANTHDSRAVDALVEPDDGELYADRAYSSWLRGKGIDPQINERAHKNLPLTDEQKAKNRLKSSVRGRVEQVFGFQINSRRAD